MDITKLTPEEKKEIGRQLAEEEKQKKAKRRDDREALKQLKDEFVSAFFPKLIEISDILAASKTEIFEAANNIVSFSKDIDGISDEEMELQQSHTISTSSFDKTIIIGSNVVDGWDEDLARSGVDGVNKWLVSKMDVSDGEKQKLYSAIRIFLRPNKEGVLKASRIMEMKTWANEMGDIVLIDSVEKIQEAYRPKKTTTYVRAKYRDENGQDVNLNLSMSNSKI